MDPARTLVVCDDATMVCKGIPKKQGRFSLILEACQRFYECPCSAATVGDELCTQDLNIISVPEV